MRSTAAWVERKLRTEVACSPAPGCWLWTGPVNSFGYPRTPFHREAWTLFNAREIPSGLVVRHLCHNKRCLAPWHLAIGTHEDNARDNRTNEVPRRFWCRLCGTRHRKGAHRQAV